VDRGAQGPRQFLGEFDGILQTDGYAGYGGRGQKYGACRLLGARFFVRLEWPTLLEASEDFSCSVICQNEDTQLLVLSASQLNLPWSDTGPHFGGEK